MGGARALIASLGASISLVAGAALSLLVVSFVFAYDGFTSNVELPDSATALVVRSPTTPTAPSRGAAGQAAAPVVITATPTPAPARKAKASAVPQQAARRVAPPARPTFDPGVQSLRPRAPAPAAVPVVRKPATGDGVRDVGEAVGATVKKTGLAGAVAPLGPPVSQAVQDVLDLLTAALQGATGGLGGVLDNAVPRR
jgi:hypothetical protein